MTAAIATIVFLSAAWLAIVAIAETALPSLSRIKAALKAEPAPELAPVQLRVSARYQPVRQPRTRVRQDLRAAA